jgi:spermidine synthase
VQRGLARRFVEVELAVALVGGASAPLLFLAFAYLPTFFRVVMYGLVVLVGTLVGLEIPLVMRLLRGVVEFKELVAKVLTFDYLGALAASLLFPILLVPHLGLVRTSILFGLANAAVALWSTWLFAPLMGEPAGLRWKAVAVLVVLCFGFAYSDQLTALAEEELYADPIVFARSTRYQRIVITSHRDRFQLFLNGNLQFSSSDEYRYHEALVHPALALRNGARRVLVLGGGDGLAAREIERHPTVSEVVLVDLDPEMTRLAVENPMLRQLNGGSLADRRVKVINEDALIWLGRDEGGGPFDAAFVDFPDPHNFSLGKLYTTRFYTLLKRHLAPDAVVAVQSTSPLMARRSFWCIHDTLQAAGFHVRAYHALVPSFGEWGYVMGALQPFEPPARAPAGLRYLDDATLRSLFVLGPDMARQPVEVNRLNNQALVRYYEDEWREWN